MGALVSVGLQLDVLPFLHDCGRVENEKSILRFQDSCHAFGCFDVAFSVLGVSPARTMNNHTSAALQLNFRVDGEQL